MKSIVFVLLIVQSFGLDFDKTKKNLEYEKSFIADLESYIDKQESVLQLLRKKLLNFQVEHADALANPERYFANEINKFLLLKRLTTDTELVVDKTFNVAKDFHQKIDKMKNDIGYPTWDELLASTIEIAKLQKREKYKTEKLAKGIFGKVKSR
jgi:prolyl 4-hydroxylase